MKKKTNNIHRILLLIIGVLAVVLAALLIHKAYELHQEKLHQEELEVRHQEVQAEIEDIQMQIKELAGDGEALQEFLNQKISRPKEEVQQDTHTTDEKERQEAEPDSGAENADEAKEAMSDAIVVPEAIPETAANESGEQEPADENRTVEDKPETAAVEPQSVTANELYGDEDAIVIAIPEKSQPQNEPESVSVNDRQEEAESVSVNQAEEPAETISDNGIREESQENTVSGNAIVNGEVIPFRYVETQLSLEERRNVRTSYVETMQINGEDKAQIARNNIDFSDMKIACLGDSLTAGNNMSDLEEYNKYSYPAMLKNILHAEEVYNLGIGGSSYGRYWDQAFVDRYKEIPEDADIIIIMGGTNDGFAASLKEMGSIGERKPRTFYGDVDELMRGLKKDYPNAKLIFATPLPNVLHDYLMNQRDYLLPQSAFADAIKQLAAEHNIDVIDLYNSNLLDTHDAQVISTYMPDGVHGNPAGYQILAEHIAGEIICIMERDAVYGNRITVSGNSSEEETVSGNSPDGETISGNSSDEKSVSDNTAEAVTEPDEDTVSANHAAQAEAERKARIEAEQKKAEELSAEEKEEIERNNKKAAENAMVVEPSKEPEKAAPPENEAAQDASSPKENAQNENVKNDYEYGGEAIVIQ